MCRLDGFLRSVQIPMTLKILPVNTHSSQVAFMKRCSSCCLVYCTLKPNPFWLAFYLFHQQPMRCCSTSSNQMLARALACCLCHCFSNYLNPTFRTLSWEYLASVCLRRWSLFEFCFHRRPRFCGSIFLCPLRTLGIRYCNSLMCLSWYRCPRSQCLQWREWFLFHVLCCLAIKS